METYDTLSKRFEKLRGERGRWENHWQELRELVNPDATDFNRSTNSGDRRTEQIMDGTAPWALEQLAAGLQSFLTSPSQRWFTLGVSDYDAEKDNAALLWLERVADMIFDCYSDPRTNFVDTIHECYQDLGSFGTAVVYQEWNVEENQLLFRSFPLASCCILENNKGMIDTLFRSASMSTRQIDQEFPEHTSKKIREEKNPDKMWCIVHAVFPRKDRDASKLTKTNKRFASCWFCPDTKDLLNESGYDMMPYHVPRWTKRAGEVYGRSPGMTCLPDIKLLNSMEKVQIKACQKIVDPPLMVPSDGFMLPIATSPSSLIYFDAGIGENNMIRPLETKGRVEIGEDKMEQKRQHILRCFYADWIARMKKKERQTATEIMDERDEMMQLMAPILGRLQTELLGPMIQLTYYHLSIRGKIPPAPSSIQRRTLKLIYTSPAAKAQFASKAMNIRRFGQELIPFAQLDPNIMDIIDMDAYAQEMAMYQDVSRKILRSPEEVAAIRKDKQQAQAMAQAAQVAEPASNAIKNLAVAKEKGMSLTE